MDATCDFQEEKKGREKPQVMHIRLRIYHIFLSWSVSKLSYTIWPLCARVCVSETEKSTCTFIHVGLCEAALSCQAFSELDMTSEAVLTFIAPLCCAALYSVSTVTRPLIVHTYHCSVEHAHVHSGKSKLLTVSFPLMT